MSDVSTVQFPAYPEKADGADLSGPVQTLLQQLSLLPKSDDADKPNGSLPPFTGPPQSVAIIEAGATALAKWWAAGLGTVITAASFTAAVQGIWGGQSDNVRIAMVGGAATLLAAMAIAIAIMVSSDVRGRATGTVALYQARAQVAVTFLSLSKDLKVVDSVASGLADKVSNALADSVKEQLKQMPILSQASDALLQDLIADGNLQIKVKGGDYQPITGLTYKDPNGPATETVLLSDVAGVKTA